MKYLFLLLLILNIGYWSWEAFISDLVYTAQRPTEGVLTLAPKTPTLTLVSEAPPPPTEPAPATSAVASTAEATPPAETPVPEKTATAPGKCYNLASRDESTLNKAVDWLGSRNIPVTQLPLPEKAIRDYRAWIPTMQSSAAAHETVTKLKAQQIDAFVIPSGDEKNGISLGVFAHEKEANDLVRYVKKKGFDAEVHPRYRGTAQFRARGGSSQLKIDDDTLEKLRAAYPELKASTTDCQN